jgi:hypothetical protein
MRRSREYEKILQSQLKNPNEPDEDEIMMPIFTPNSQPTVPNTPISFKPKIDVENLPIPLGKGVIKTGFIVFGVLMLVESIFFLLSFNLSDFLGGLLLAVFSFLLAGKVHYRYTEETNFYFYNFSVTLKGLLNHYRTTSVLMEGSEKILIYSVLLMTIQHFLLSWFSLTSVLYTIGYYGVFLGILLNLVKRKTMLIYKGLFLYAILLFLMNIQNGFGSFHYINYHTALSFCFFWYFAGFFQSVKITNVHIDKDESSQKEINDER